MHEVNSISTQANNIGPSIPVAELQTLQEPASKDLNEPGLRQLHIQKKLSIGGTDDPLEKEADRMADKVMRMPETFFAQKKCAECEQEEDLQRKCTEPFIQLKCNECKNEEAEEEERVQRKPVSTFLQKNAEAGNHHTSDRIAEQIQSTQGGGEALPASSRYLMENSFAADFSSVKIHTGSYANMLSQQLHAQAFTVGNDIYFNSGKYNPHTNDGKHLLAHELTHTIQQGASSSTAVQRIQRKTEGETADAPETVVTYTPSKKNPAKEGRMNFEYRAEKQLPFVTLNTFNHPLMIWAVQHVFNITEEAAADIVLTDSLVWSTSSGRTKDYLAGSLVKFTLPTHTIGKWIEILATKGMVDPNVSALFVQMMELQQTLSDRDYSFFIEWAKSKGIIVTSVTDFQNLTPDSLKKFKQLYAEFNANKYKLITRPKEYFLTTDITRDMRFEDLKDRFFNKDLSQLTPEEKRMILDLFQDKVLSTAFIALEESKIISKQEVEKYRQHPELLTEVAMLITGYSPGFIKNIEARFAEFGKFNKAYYNIIQAAPTRLSSPIANSSYSQLQNYYYTYEQMHHDVGAFFSMYSYRKGEIISMLSAGKFENILAAELAGTLSVYAWASKDNLRSQSLPEEIDNPLFRQFKQKFPNPGAHYDTDKLKSACLDIIMSTYPDLASINSSDQDALNEMRLLGLNKKHRILYDISIDFRSLAMEDLSSVKEKVMSLLGEKPGKVDKTQSRLIGDADLVWEFQPLLYHILQQEHIDSNHPIYKVVDAKIKSVADKSFWESLALGALALVLGIAGIFTGGITTGLGFSLLALSATAGIIDLAFQYAEYSIQSDAHAAAFTVPFAEDPSSIGLWLSLLGVVLDLKGLMEVFEQSAKVAGKIAKTGAEASQVTDAALKNLAQTKNIDEYAEQMYEILNGKKILNPAVSKEAFIKSLKESWRDSHELIESWKKYESVLDRLPVAVKASVESSGLLKLPVEIRSSILKVHEYNAEAFNKLITTVAHHPEQLQVIGLQLYRSRTLANVYGQLSQVLENSHFEKVVHYFAGVGHSSANALPELLHLMNSGNIFSKGELALQVLTNRKVQQLTLNLSSNPGELVKLWDNFASHSIDAGDDFVRYVEKNSPYGGLTKLEESSSPVAKIKGPETNKGVLTDLNGRPPSPKALEGLGEDMDKLLAKVEDPKNISEVTDARYTADYDAEVSVGEHTFRRDRATGKWCRFTDPVCNVETPTALNGKVDEVLGNPEGVKIDSPEAETTSIDVSEISEAAPKPGQAGSQQHRQQRWAEYEKRMEGNPKKWKQKRWDNVYDKNMDKAKNANKAVEAYKARETGWVNSAEREVRVEIEGIERRFDLMETANIPPGLRKEGIIHLEELEKAGIKPKVVEHKTGKIYNTQDIQWEIARDEILVKEKGWLIEWVFEGTASGPLKKQLEKAGIPFKEITVP